MPRAPYGSRDEDSPANESWPSDSVAGQRACGLEDSNKGC